MIVTHLHHIVPKHAGGTDDSNNLVELTIEDHAIAHKVLYWFWKREEDRLAWLALSGKIGTEEVRIMAIKLAMADAELKKRQSEFMKGNQRRVGCIWITNGVKNKVIHKSKQIPEGWRKGRSITSPAAHPNARALSSKRMKGNKIGLETRFKRSGLNGQ